MTRDHREGAPAAPQAPPAAHLPACPSRRPAHARMRHGLHSVAGKLRPRARRPGKRASFLLDLRLKKRPTLSDISKKKILHIHSGGYTPPPTCTPHMKMKAVFCRTPYWGEDRRQSSPLTTVLGMRRGHMASILPRPQAAHKAQTSLRPRRCGVEPPSLLLVGLADNAVMVDEHPPGL